MPALPALLKGWWRHDVLDDSRVDQPGHLGVFARPPARGVVRRLYDDRFVGVCRRGHAALASGRMTLARFVAADLARRGLERRIALVVPYMMTLGGVVAGSNLVAAVAERAARQLAADGLVIFELPVRIERWHVHMLSSSERRAEPGNAWLRARVEEAAARAA